METFKYSPEGPYADGLWDSAGDITLAGAVCSMWASVYVQGVPGGFS